MPIRAEKQGVDVNAEELISVTVDASDLSATATEPIRSIVSRYGRPVSSRAFADFQQPNLSDLAVQLYQMGFTLVHCPSWPNGDGYPKSIVSDVVAQDLRDQLEQLEDVRTYILVATSRDYIAVANALKRHDARVVVVAEDAKVCRELRTCADEFVVLPPSRPEPVRHGRSERIADASPSERAVEQPRSERSTGGSRSRRTAESSRSERSSEAARAEREGARPERIETPELVRLPSDAEVVAEVKRIVAAEGICTPRRLARALCPVDRTPTGELRSRIANRIQALIDSGKLQRERLVVGGTSVETILARDERDGREAHPVLPDAIALGGAYPSAVLARETEPAGALDLVPGDETEEVEEAKESAEGIPVVDTQPPAESVAADLDAFVESVLRSQEPPTEPANRDGEAGNEPMAAPAEPAPVAETPKRSRPRRRSTSKAAAPETNGTA